jgi:two-component system, NtrC family, response regulator AtoC
LLVSWLFFYMVKILVIDDDRHMRAACSRVLTKAGWLVTCAESGDQGLKEILNVTQKFDVVLVDQLMPGISGMEALAQIRAIDPHLPVILMTGSATDDSALEIKKLGARDCLPKPFTPEQLRNVIISAIQRTDDAP